MQCQWLTLTVKESPFGMTEAAQNSPAYHALVYTTGGIEKKRLGW